MRHGNFYSSLIFFLIFFSGCTVTQKTEAQIYQPEKIKGDAVRLYDKAVEALQTGQTTEGEVLLKKAVDKDPRYVDAWLSLSGVLGEKKKYAEAVQAFDRAWKLDTVYASYYLLPYSINLAGAGEFAKASDAINRFLSLPKLGDKSVQAARYRSESYQFALANSAASTRRNYIFNPVNLGDSINSPMAEYYPSCTIDDSVLVFTRRMEGIRENFLKSTLIGNGYSKADDIVGSLNAEPSKGAINISQDGEWLLFAGNFPGKGEGNFDIYISYSIPGGWSEPFNLGPQVNTEFWESGPSLSPDKRDLYFSSTSPDGFGGSDIYVSHFQNNGRFGPAYNLGPTINTSGDELAPFIHADNQSLYFTSSGLPGYGGTDLFVARKKTDSSWHTPQNLGYPINTIDNEGSLFIAADAVTAYYASDRADSRGSLDIYKFSLPEEVRPLKTLYVKGHVTDAQTGRPLPSLVELSEDSSLRLVNKVQTDETGFYFITLPLGKNYTFTVNRKGYLFYSSRYSLVDKSSDSIYKNDIRLTPLTVNAAITLQNIQFAVNSAVLEPVSIIELKKLLTLMEENPGMSIQIIGHTDNTGSPASNKILSENRAKAVAAYLAAEGIHPSRLKWTGMGDTQPLADNKTENGQALNRRTEIKITDLK